MVYTRAPASDFDDWRVDGWESENLIPLMKKVIECVVRMFLKLNCYILCSWRVIRCSPVVQPTGMRDPSRYPLVGINSASLKSSSVLPWNITRGHIPTTPMISKHATHTLCVTGDLDHSPFTTNQIRLSH